VKTLNDIRAEIERLSERRAELWHALSEGRDSALAEELHTLEARLEKLWDEQRAVRAQLRFGERDKIIARARTEERLARAA
jgi:hypothetical protein